MAAQPSSEIWCKEEFFCTFTPPCTYSCLSNVRCPSGSPALEPLCTASLKLRSKGYLPLSATTLLLAAQSLRAVLKCVQVAVNTPHETLRHCTSGQGEMTGFPLGAEVGKPGAEGWGGEWEAASGADTTLGMWGGDWGVGGWGGMGRMDGEW